MFDTMTMTKLLGGFCGAFLIFLLGGFGAEFIYHEKEHHDGDHHQAYTIDTGGSNEAEEEAVVVTLAEVAGGADVASGEKLFKKCAACHKLDDGANGVGPHLYGVVGRGVAAADGFGYSGNLIAVADVWTPENLYAFFENPKAYAPGTKMNFKGYPKPQDRADLIAFLETIGG